MEWIKCKDKIPKSGERCLFINGKGEVTFGYAYSYEEWKSEENGSIWINDMDRETNEVATHWMPLPKPPK